MVSAGSEVEEDGVWIDVELNVGFVVSVVDCVVVLSLVVDMKLEVVCVVVEVVAGCVVISAVVDNGPEKLDFNIHIAACEL